MFIKEVVDVASENPTQYIWKNLRYFLDEKMVAVKHAEFFNAKLADAQAAGQRKHEQSISPTDDNTKKQARQLTYCIRQAEEYFRASSQVGLATRPVLLYYGAVALTKALILLKQDGNHSFDGLRKSGNHKSHGLQLAGAISKIKSEDEADTFLTNIRCSCDTNESDYGRIPWGHFPIFYDSLVGQTFLQSVEVQRVGHKGCMMQRKEARKCAEVFSVANLLDKEFDALSLLKCLPDLYTVLTHFKITPNLAPGSWGIHEHLTIAANQDGTDAIQARRQHYVFAVNGLDGAQKSELIAEYQRLNSSLGIGLDVEQSLVFNADLLIPPDVKVVKFYTPDIMSDINGSLYFILKQEDYLHEVAAMFILLFGFGMLARYHSDLWMRTLDKHVQITEILDFLFNIIYRTFPNLLLDQMTLAHHHVRLT